MPMSHLRRAAWQALASVCVLFPSTLVAQGSAGRAISFGVGAGVTVPSGDFSDCCKAGWNAAGFVQWRQPNQVFGLRGDLQYHRNDVKDEFLVELGGSDATSGHYSITNFGVDGIMEVAPKAGSVGWYLLAGVGMYNVEASVTEGGITASQSDSKAGFNAGGGLRFRAGSLGLFAEARWHNVKIEDATFNLIPITFGITW